MAGLTCWGRDSASYQHVSLPINRVPENVQMVQLEGDQVEGKESRAW